MIDLFERLGLPRRFSIDAGEVERRYLARSRECHPDLHGQSTDAEQAAALERSASLNRAYATLADPARRAEHLLALLGGPTAGQEKSLDQTFLMEMMETRERMDELRAVGGDLRELEAELERRYERTLSDVAGRFENPGPGELVAIRRGLNAARTIQSLLRDLRGTPDPN
jgi:molecular chaperone HscB